MVLFIIVILVLGAFFFAVLVKSDFEEHLAARKAAAATDAGREFFCRVEPVLTGSDDGTRELFEVQIRGCIDTAPEATDGVAPAQEPIDTNVQVEISDVTGGADRADAVLTKIRQYQKAGTEQFCYCGYNGRLPSRHTVLSDWLTVAFIRRDCLVLPRKGRRMLQFAVSVVSGPLGRRLASATATLEYDNDEFGYIDQKVNTRRARRLATVLALAVSAADGRMCESEIELITDWARRNLGGEQPEQNTELTEAIEEAVEYFRGGKKVDVADICRMLVEISPLWQRYRILELCMYVAAADGVATGEELDMLTGLGAGLELNEVRFRAMLEKILPVGMHATEDVQFVLGITADMSGEQARRRLNQEYRKWNARVTHLDPEVRAQAGDMLKLIAETRSEYVG